MADQIYNASCGFFNAVNDDRKYTAEQMNLLYDRVIADGVFATPQGTPSNDLQVFAGTGMNVSVTKGAGIFAHKWFRLMSNILFTVPGNTSGNSRIDSVIVQIDTRNSGRCGNVVYRQGEPSATPTAPAINLVVGVTEYRVANIAVASMATAITQADITDLRGSESCLWVTSLLQQVDTSTLWAQYQAAYAEQFEKYHEDYEEYKDLQHQAWEEFLSTLTDELTVSTNVATYTSTYTAMSTVQNIPINIASYNHQVDVLQVFINGLYASSDKYTLNVNHTSIDLTTPIAAGNSVYFVVFKSLIGAGNESAITLMEELDAKFDSYFGDSGWSNISLDGTVEADEDNPPMERHTGEQVFLRGALSGVTGTGDIGFIALKDSPESEHSFVTVATDGTSITATMQITITPRAGQKALMSVTAISGTLSATDKISICTNYITDYRWD